MEEILHQLIWKISYYLQGWGYIQTVVVWDFFHQPYHRFKGLDGFQKKSDGRKTILSFWDGNLSGAN